MNNPLSRMLTKAHLLRWPLRSLLDVLASTPASRLSGPPRIWDLSQHPEKPLCQQPIRPLGLLLILLTTIGLIGWKSMDDGPTVKESLPQKIMIENFSGYPADQFPRRFRTYPFQRTKALKVYKTAQENRNVFLKAMDNEDLSIIIFLEFLWDIQNYPSISWQWRAYTLPKEADERNRPTNDSACGVYISFGRYNGKALKYTWSTLAPVGTIHKKKPGEIHIIVKESGHKKLGQWQKVSINILKDYEDQFGSPPERNPSGIALLTDANATHSSASCDYDNFVIFR